MHHALTPADQCKYQNESKWVFGITDLLLMYLLFCGSAGGINPYMTAELKQSLLATRPLSETMLAPPVPSAQPWGNGWLWSLVIISSTTLCTILHPIASGIEKILEVTQYDALQASVVLTASPAHGSNHVSSLGATTGAEWWCWLWRVNASFTSAPKKKSGWIGTWVFSRAYQYTGLKYIFPL